MRRLTVAATQMPCGWDRQANLDRAEHLVRQAAGQGAKVILLQELFETPYFCAGEKSSYFGLATAATENVAVQRFAGIARELGVVLPISFFERGENSYFNSLAMIDADGRVLTVYRKSHIPQAPGYQEKFYFTPGDSGIRVVDTAYGRIGAAVCWDQWFPECARLLALQGAELLLYPTAIGSEPSNDGYDSRDHWRRCMQGHAAANMVPVIASNRIGTEKNDSCDMHFYGSSFITDQFGGLLAEADRETSGVITATVELDEIKEQRASWGLFRDRRIDLYAGLLSHHGQA
ncbi:MAG TPA: N-carbamoylputrescine amidase [Terriglobales bacterium]|nr:N-carbamoylputrescine amidase [Terriglobales bacterium]